MKVRELFENVDILEAFKEVPTHLKSGKPNPNHPAYEKHKAAYSEVQKTEGKKKRALTAAEKKKQLDNALHLCAVTITTADGWGEMDSVDMITLKILPALKKAIRANPDKYGEDFEDAVWDAHDEWGNHDKVYKFFDKAVQKYEDAKDFHDWVDTTMETYKELMADQKSYN